MPDHNERDTDPVMARAERHKRILIGLTVILIALPLLLGLSRALGWF